LVGVTLRSLPISVFPHGHFVDKPKPLKYWQDAMYHLIIALLDNDLCNTDLYND